MAIVLTETAAEEIKRYMEAQKVEPEAVLRIGVLGGGCSGLQYSLGFETGFDPKIDTRYQQHGVATGDLEEDGPAPGRDGDRFSRRTDGPRVFDREPKRSPRRRLSRLRTPLAA